MHLLKNIGWTVLARFGVQALSVLSNILIARSLGRDGFGEYAFISSILLIGNAFSTFGTDMILIRELASKKNSFTLADGLQIQVFLSVLCIVIVFAVDYFVSVPLSLKIYIFSLLPLAFFTIFNIELRSRQEMRRYSMFQLISAVLQVGAALFLAVFHGNVDLFAVLMLAAYIFIAWLAFVFQKAQAGRWVFSFSSTLSLWKVCIPMAVIGTLRLVYEKIAIAVFPAVAGLSMTGLFSVSSRVMEAGKLGHLAAFTAMYPEMTRNASLGKQTKGLGLFLGTGFFISTCLFIFSEFIVYFLFGAEFQASVLPLRVMVWTIVPYVLVTYTSLGLVALGYEQPVLISLLAALLALLILLIILTPTLGLTGAALAVLVAEVLHAAVLWYQWRAYAVPEFSR